jgi:hypothetical protein
MPKASLHQSSTITKLPYHYKERRTEIFWSFVEKTDSCWLWQHYIRKDGYGGFSGKPAQWYAWEITKGPRPEGKWILHRCNNRRCVNPEHLYAGTHADNTRDAVMAGTMGRKPTTAHLYDEILELLRKGKAQTWIAEKLGVSQAHVSNINKQKYRGL